MAVKWVLVIILKPDYALASMSVSFSCHLVFVQTWRNSIIDKNSAPSERVKRAYDQQNQLVFHSEPVLGMRARHALLKSYLEIQI